MLRKGTNGWVCVPDDPNTPGKDPVCMNDPWLDFREALKNKSIGEALNELNRAHDLVNAKGDELEEWKAEMAAAWAVYYYHTGGQ